MSSPLHCIPELALSKLQKLPRNSLEYNITEKNKDISIETLTNIEIQVKLSWADTIGYTKRCPYTTAEVRSSIKYSINAVVLNDIFCLTALHNAAIIAITYCTRMLPLSN